MRSDFGKSAVVVALLSALLASPIGINARASTGAATQDYLSPSALAPAPDGKTLYVACATAGQVFFVDLSSRAVTQHVSLPGNPSGLAITKDGRRLYVTCAAPCSTVCIIHTSTAQVLHKIPVGHTAPMALRPQSRNCSPPATPATPMAALPT